MIPQGSVQMDDSNSTYRQLILDPSYSSVHELPARQRRYIRRLLRAEAVCTLGTKVAQKSYAQATVEDVLATVLPSHTRTRLGRVRLRAVGGIGVLQLRNKALECLQAATPTNEDKNVQPDVAHTYGRALGELLLDKRPELQSIVARRRGETRSITSVFQEWFVLALRAGEDTALALQTTVEEAGIRLDVDLQRAFWNGRRAEERGQLVHELVGLCEPAAGGSANQQHWVICDATAGGEYYPSFSVSPGKNRAENVVYHFAVSCHVHYTALILLQLAL